jgi:hypothetical protein
LRNPKCANHKTSGILEGRLWLKKCWFANDDDDDYDVDDVDDNDSNVLSLH